VNLFDSSALLCFLQGERGADVVEGALIEGGRCCAANWSEVAQKVLQHRRDWPLARALLHGWGVTVEPVLPDDAELAASTWRPGTTLSLADRLCLATAERLDAVVWTADTAWGTTNRVRQIR
jgi:ribonuclease VapC